MKRVTSQDANPIHRVSTSVRRRAERATDGDTAPQTDLTGFQNPSGLTAPRNLPERWRRARLGDLCFKTELVNPEKQPDKPFQYVDVSSVSNESFRVVDAKTLLGRDAPSRARKAIQANDVIFATVRPTLKRVAMILPELDGEVCSTGFCVLRANKTDLDSSFLYFHLLTEPVAAQVEYLQKGATYPAINDSDLCDLSIPLPPLPVQRAIAHALRTVQQARAARQRELTLERERKAALMEHLFTHGTRNEPRKQTEIGEMPESWRVVKLGDEGKPKGGRRLPKGESFADAKTPFPYIRVVDLENGSVNTENLKYLRPEIKKVISNYTISKQDVYISIAGTIGVVGVVPDELDGANLTENAARIVINDLGRLDNHFLFRFLDSKSGQRQIQNLTAKTTQPKLALGRVEQIRIPIPSLDEQRAIASTLRACDAKIAALEREAAGLDELFRAMLDEMMTGRLRVT